MLIAETVLLLAEPYLFDHGKAAIAHIARMGAYAGEIGKTGDCLGKRFSGEEKLLIRSERTYSAEMVKKTVCASMALSRILFQRCTGSGALSHYDDLLNTLIFRVSLCRYLLELDWWANGGSNGAGVSKLRNDFIDIFFAAYATFFDGFLTADKKALRIYRQASHILTRAGGVQ